MHKDTLTKMWTEDLYYTMQCTWCTLFVVKAVFYYDFSRWNYTQLYPWKLCRGYGVVSMTWSCQFLWDHRYTNFTSGCSTVTWRKPTSETWSIIGTLESSSRDGCAMVVGQSIKTILWWILCFWKITYYSAKHEGYSFINSQCLSVHMSVPGLIQGLDYLTKNTIIL